jgi:hypothetical protein
VRSSAAGFAPTHFDDGDDEHELVKQSSHGRTLPEHASAEAVVTVFARGMPPTIGRGVYQNGSKANHRLGEIDELEEKCLAYRGAAVQLLTQRFNASWHFAYVMKGEWRSK